MRKFLLLLSLLGFYNITIAQVIYPYKDIKLEKPADYKATEKMALSAATFLITTPFIEVDEARGGALIFLNAWMTGTKDYQFYFQGIAQEISVDKNLLSLFVAAMAKYTLENKAEAVNPIRTEQQTAKIVLTYCDDPKNNFKLKKKLRKLLEDHLPANN
ncbi:MAG: hypothetical protein JNM14_00865 [Ferruginibacter sp.]|nr:hypothetical protein [Ferruginibacter sp.]